MNRFYLIFKFLLDKSIPLKEKWWIILPLIYILSPADLIPAPILGFSLIDDAVMLFYLMSVVNSKAKKYYGNNKEHSNKNKDDFIENVEYKIYEDEQ